MRLFAYASLALLFACTTASTSSEGDPTDPTGGAGGQGGGSSGQGGDAAKPRKVCTRFAAEPSAWAVPDASFNRVNATYGQWLTMDLDGDGKVDLVRANDPDNDGKPYGAAAGKPHWQFFKGEKSGFAKAPTEWAVPDSLFNRVNATYGQWLTMDLDNDGTVDLVRANDPDNDGNAYGAKSGKPHWQVFKGGDTGFAKAPAEWPVPEASFNRVNATYGQWLTMDLDGDGCVDLVRANDPKNDGKAFSGPSWQRFGAE